MGIELVLERLQMEPGDVGIGDENIGGRWECSNDRVCDVWDEVESAVDGLLAQYRDFVDVRGSRCHRLQANFWMM